MSPLAVEVSLEHTPRSASVSKERSRTASPDAPLAVSEAPPDGPLSASVSKKRSRTASPDAPQALNPVTVPVLKQSLSRKLERERVKKLLLETEDSCFAIEMHTRLLILGHFVEAKRAHELGVSQYHGILRKGATATPLVRVPENWEKLLAPQLKELQQRIDYGRSESSATRTKKGSHQQPSEI